MATVAGLDVAAVILVFTFLASGSDVTHGKVVSDLDAETTAQFAFAIGLLVLSLAACLLSSISFSALAAESGMSPRHNASIMISGAPAAVGVISILAAFEVLANIYLTDARRLFAVIAWAASLWACIIVAIVIHDVIASFGRPRSYPFPKTSLRPRSESGAAALWVTLATTAGILVTAGLGVHIWIRTSALTLTEVYFIVGVGIGYVFGMSLWSLLQSMPNNRSDGRLGAIRSSIVVLSLGLFLGAMLALLP